jgi:hypothetical protein
MPTLAWACNFPIRIKSPAGWHRQANLRPEPAEGSGVVICRVKISAWKSTQKNFRVLLFSIRKFLLKPHESRTTFPGDTDSWKYLGQANFIYDAGLSSGHGAFSIRLSGVVWAYSYKSPNTFGFPFVGIANSLISDRQT